jgi:phosphoribosyl 1,2-cyclic phosphate phosphodiesterase
MHGSEEIHGYRFGSAAYLTDFSEIPEESMAQLAGLDILFLDALRHRPHPTHSTLENSVRLVERLQPRRAFFTHISHDLGHEETNRALPGHVRLAHDGLKLEFEI